MSSPTKYFVLRMDNGTSFQFTNGLIHIYGHQSLTFLSPCAPKCTRTLTMLKFYGAHTLEARSYPLFVHVRMEILNRVYLLFNHFIIFIQMRKPVTASPTPSLMPLDLNSLPVPILLLVTHTRTSRGKSYIYM